MSWLNDIFGGHVALGLFAGIVWAAMGSSWLLQSINKDTERFQPPFGPRASKWMLGIAAFLVFTSLLNNDAAIFKEGTGTYLSARTLAHTTEKAMYFLGVLPSWLFHRGVSLVDEEIAHWTFAVTLYIAMLIIGHHGANHDLEDVPHSPPEAALHMLAWYPTAFVAIMAIAQAFIKKHDPYRILQGIAAIVAGVWYAVVGTMAAWAGWCDGYQLKWGGYDDRYYNPNCADDAWKIETLLVPPLFAFVTFVVGTISLCCLAQFRSFRSTRNRFNTVEFQQLSAQPQQ